MNQYLIKYSSQDMPKDYVGRSVKWAHNERDAINLLLRNKYKKEGTCTFKRGSHGHILSVEEIK